MIVRLNKSELLVDQQYTAIEYMRLRKRHNQEQIREIVKDIGKKDDRVREELLERMRGIYGKHSRKSY